MQGGASVTAYSDSHSEKRTNYVTFACIINPLLVYRAVRRHTCSGFKLTQHCKGMFTSEVIVLAK